MSGRGWRLFVTAFVLWLAGRVLGIAELIQIGVALATLCLVGLLIVITTPRRVSVRRLLPQSPVFRGSEVTVGLLVKNHHRLPTPLLQIVEPLPAPFGEQRFFVSVESGRERLIEYGLTPARRGRYVLPATKVTVSDPFGVAERSREYGGEVSLLVYPRTEVLASSEGASVRMGRGERQLHLPGGGHTQEFYALRDYIPGDDPRKIHWRSTAKSGRLLVREEEAKGRQRATVFLDDRASAHSFETFEWAVDAAASSAALYVREGFLVRVAAASGELVPYGRGGAHLRRMLEALAFASTSPAAPDRLRSLARGGHEGLLVAALGRLTPMDAVFLQAAARRFEEVVTILPREIEARQLNAIGSLPSTPGVRVVAAARGESLADAWARSLWSVTSVSSAGPYSAKKG